MDEYIRKQDVKDALQEKVFHNLTDEFYGAMQVLDELEPADVVPVVHGRWSHIAYLKGIKVMECSHCGKRVLGSHNYCGNCGAKMDGGESDG